MMKDVGKGLVGAVCMVVLLGCQSGPRPTTDYDAGYDFSNVQTFSWIDPNPLIRATTQQPLNPLIQERLMRDTRTALTRRGFRFVDAPLGADIVLAFTVGSRENIRVTSHPSTSFNRGRHSHSWRGYWPTSTVQTRQYTQGQLAIDVFSVNEARPVWHGTVSQRITQRDRSAPDESVRTAVEAIIDQFPPG